MKGRTVASRRSTVLASLAVLTAVAAWAAPQPPQVGSAPPVGVAPVLLDGRWGDDDTGEDEKATADTGTWDAKKDLGSLYSVTKSTGAQRAWAYEDADGDRLTGKGVTVALIDTGVAPVPGLDEPGKVVNGPDLSFESQAPGTRYLDGYGHGTHLAGIIAARDATVRAGDEKDADSVVGVAPDARILNVKVGSGDGGVDVSQVIAAVDWVVQHRRDNGMNVRVINLSYGTHSRLPYTSDPLAHAVENAWRAGIVVVAAGGNDGTDAPALTMPAAHPRVLSVGAVDHQGTATERDDAVADFSTIGRDGRDIDVVAPGKSVVSLRVPGSYADREHPEGLVTGDRGGRLFRGSGSSQAAAVVSGAAALLLQQRPALTADQAKWILRASARPVGDERAGTAGYGALDVLAALRNPTPVAASAEQDVAATSGDGSLELARGDGRIVDPDNGVTLDGEVDALGTAWDADRWAAASTAGTAWTGGVWNSRRWSGDTWSGSSWAAATWTGLSWSGADWASRRWSSDAWVSRRWSGDDWSSRRWSAEAWTSRRWSGSDWTASTR